MPVSVRSRCEHMFVRRKDEAQREARRCASWAGRSGASRASSASRSPRLACGCADWSHRRRRARRRDRPTPCRRDASRVELGELRRCGRCGHHLPTSASTGSAMACSGGAGHASRVLPRARRHASTPVVRRQAGAPASAASADARAPASRPVRRLRRGRSGGPRVRPPRREDREHLCAALADSPREAVDAEIAAARSCAPTATDGGRPAEPVAPRSRRGSPRARTHPGPSSGTSLTSTTSCDGAPASTAASETRSCSSSITSVSSGRGHALGVVRLQPRHDRRRDREVRDPLRQLPPPHDRHARRPFPLPGPKLPGAPVAQLV